MKKKYRTHKDLEKMAENYFAEQEELNKPCSIAGISYFMGFADKSEFLELEKDEEFAPVINRDKITAGKDDMAELMQNAKKLIDEAETNE